MARRRQRRSINPEEFPEGSGRFLAERLKTLGINQNEFARRLGKGEAKNVNSWFGKPGDPQPARRPNWESAVQIARVLDMPFDAVRMGLGYQSPDEPAGERPDGWDLESLRLAHQLLNLLRHVPPEARAGVRLAVAANLGALAAELARLGAQVDVPLP